MASSVMMSTALAPSSLRGASISSSRVARFEAPAPVKMTPRRNVAVRASASDNTQPRRAFLATIAALSMGAGAALADQGRKEVRDKANELLKAADDLTNSDSPPRYGGNRGEDPSQSDRGAARMQWPHSQAEAEGKKADLCEQLLKLNPRLGGGDAKEQAKAGLNKLNFSLEKSSRDIYGRARKQIEKALS